MREMSSSTQFIVTTTINRPTEAIERFDALPDWTLIVVGDLRTPADYSLPHGIYLSPTDQGKLAPRLSKLIGWNCIQRRNLGFVLALDLAADVIATIDDDNIPYENWGRNLLVGETSLLKTFEANNGCFDPLGATEHGHLWHRGYPLQLLQMRNQSNFSVMPTHIDVQADFWDGDPDVDAVCRLEHAPSVQFDPRRFPFTANALSPFNSQNTFVTRDALTRYFVVPGVGRMDDIWAGFHLQSLGFKVAYGPSSVRQRRNPHSLTRDLAEEFLGYRLNADLVQAINDQQYDIADYWPERARLAYDEYLRRVKA